MSQDQGTGAQHWAPGGAVVSGGKWPDSWIELLMLWPTSRWLAKERLSTACSPVPSKSISRAKLVVEHTPVMFLLQLDSFPCPEPQPCLWQQQGKPCLWVCWKLSCCGWAWQALVRDWKKRFPLRHHRKGEEHSQISGALCIHRSLSKHSRVLEHKTDRHLSLAAGKSNFMGEIVLVYMEN